MVGQVPDLIQVQSVECWTSVQGGCGFKTLPDHQPGSKIIYAIMPAVLGNSAQLYDRVLGWRC